MTASTRFRLIRAGLILVAILVVLVGVLLGGLATAPGRALLAHAIERSVHAGGFSIAITNLSGWPPFDFGAGKVVLSDASGPFAEIDGLSARLRPLPLLAAIVDAEHLSADRVAVIRRPALVREDEQGGSATLSLDRLAIARLELGPDLIGRPASLLVAGSYASRSDGALRANINAERIDGKTATLRATLARVRQAAPLALDVTVDEGADGILAGLIGRDDVPAYRIAARTQVDGDALDGTLAINSSGEARFDGRYSSKRDGTRRTLVANGEGNLGELLPPNLVALLGGPLTLALDADIHDDKVDGIPRIVVRQGMLRGSSVRAEASGRIDGGASDLTFRLDAGAETGPPLRMPGVDGLSVQTFSAHGRATPAGALMRADATMTVARLTVPNASVPRAEIAVTISSASGGLFARGKLPFTLKVDADRIDTPRLPIRASPGAPLTLAAEGTVDATDGAIETRATLDAASARIAFDGGFAKGTVRGRATARVPDLRALAGLAGRPLSGAFEATAAGTFYAPAGIEVDVDAKATNLDPGDATAARLLGGASTWRSHVVLGTGGRLALSNLALDAPAVNARGSLDLGPANVAADVSGQLADLGVLARDTSGSAAFAVKANGARQAPNIEASVRLDRGRLLGKPVERVVARLDGKPGANGWSGRVGLEGTYAGQRIEGGADATLASASGALALPRIDVRVGENRIRGALTRSPRGLLDGTLDVSAPDLATLAGLALVEAAGSVTAKLTFGAQREQQTLAVTFNGKDLHFSGVALGAAEGAADLDDPFGAPRLRGRVDARAIAIGTFRLDTATARATAAGDMTRFALAAKNADLDLASSATLTQRGSATQLGIETLTGTAYRIPLRLTTPAAIDIDGERVVVRNVALALGGGTLRVEGSAAPTLDLAIDAERVSAALANVFVPDLGAEGTLSGRATVTGAPSSLVAQWSIDGSGLRAAATRQAGLPAIAVRARGRATTTATSGETTLDGTVSGGGATLTVQGRVPFGGEGLALRAQGTAPLALLALQSRRELRLGGSLRANVEVSGALDAPQISGTADLVDATFADTETAFGITGATGRIAFDGRRASLQQVKGRLLQGGQVSAGGYIDTTGDLPADINVHIEGGRFADGRIVNTSFGGDLAIRGPLLADAVVSGNVVLSRTQIQLPDRFGGANDAIRVKHVNTAPGFKDPLAARRDRVATESGQRKGALKLAIELTNTGGIFVRGFGIDAEFGGSLKLTGTIDAPDAIGAFTMRYGRLDLLGKRFDLSSGRLTFAGDLIPLLDFQAKATATDTTVTLSVVGPASDPVITLTSVPDLPQEEIMAKLLFERNVGSLSALQAAQLIDAISRFTGVRSGSSMLDRIRQATGLDDLDVKQNATGGTTVGVARRLSDRLRLGVEAGAGSTGSRVTVDLDITRELKARGEAGQDGGRVGLTYEHEY